MNPLIALQSRAVDTRTASRNISNFFTEKKNDERQQKVDAENAEIKDLQKERLQLQVDSEKTQQEKDKEESILIGSSMLNDFIESGDIEGGKAYLQQRGSNLFKNGTPSEDTAEALRLLDENPTALLNSTRAAKKEAISRGLITQGKDGGFTLSQGQTKFDVLGNVIASVDAKSDVLSSKAEEQKIRLAQASRAETNITIGADGNPVPVVTPAVLLEGLPPAVAAKVDATFIAAGGGKDGINAIDKVKSEFQEDERRLVSGKLIQESFPNATPAELKQLEATMDSAVTTESGLTKAKSVREEQRRLTKAAGFQDRAITLIKGILSNDQLPDVLGSIEGSIDMRFSDAEAELIADIEEVSNILTADNLNLMTGVLSETDIKILANLASGGLNRKRSESRFKKDAGDILSKLSLKRVETVNDGNDVTIGRFKVKAK